jgi:hypothetical protein
LLQGVELFYVRAIKHKLCQREIPFEIKPFLWGASKLYDSFVLALAFFAGFALRPHPCALFTSSSNLRDKEEAMLR